MKFEYRGRRYRASSGTYLKTLAREIERQRRRAVEEAANGIRRHRDAAILFSIAAKEWLALKQTSWAPKSHIAATLDIRHLSANFASCLLVDIDVRAVADYVGHRRVGGAAEKTIRNELGTLRGLLRHYRLWASLKDDGVVLPRGSEARNWSGAVRGRGAAFADRMRRAVDRGHFLGGVSSARDGPATRRASVVPLVASGFRERSDPRGQVEDDARRRPGGATQSTGAPCASAPGRQSFPARRPAHSCSRRNASASVAIKRSQLFSTRIRRNQSAAGKWHGHRAQGCRGLVPLA